MAAPPPLACGNCGAPMRALRLAGHYGQQVEIDLCEGCHLVWFDPVESARLAGPGLLGLIEAMAAAQSLPHRAAAPAMHCARCRGPLREVHNRTRWGRSRQLECAVRHGAYQTFAQFLAERGLLRPMDTADRARARRHAGALHCVNCGGVIAPAHDACPWCAALPAVVDVARLARALDPEGATERHPVHRHARAAASWSCLACGAALAQPDWRCGQCGATLAAPGLGEAQRAVATLAPLLAAHAERPSAEVVRRRLAAQQPGLDRQRARSAQMQAEADAQAGHWGAAAPAPDDGFDLADVWALVERGLRRLGL